MSLALNENCYSYAQNVQLVEDRSLVPGCRLSGSFKICWKRKNFLLHAKGESMSHSFRFYSRGSILFASTRYPCLMVSILHPSESIANLALVLSWFLAYLPYRSYHTCISVSKRLMSKNTSGTSKSNIENKTKNVTIFRTAISVN